MVKGLLAAVEKKYALTIQHFEVIRDTTRTFVLKVIAEQGIFILKSMYTDEHRLQFILEAEDFIRSRGIKIPSVLLTNENKLYFTYKGEYFVLQQWICAVPYRLTSIDKTVRLAQLLGEIHSFTKGYQPSFGPFYYGAAKWEQEYEENVGYLESWRIDSLKIEEEWKLSVLEYLDFFISTGTYVKENVKTNIIFHSWNENHPNLVLSHSDFHTQNVLMDESLDLHIIDWEFVRLDFPSRDINRLLYAMLKKSTAWNHQVFNTMMRAYLNRNWLSDQEMKLMYLDLAFPHNFCRNLIWGKFARMTVNQIKDLLQKEYDKTVYLLDCYKK
ncbi:hypothetical protein ASG89_08045 [Paenibacillus sp. Soil766]|uniref:phosphotransferase n=1 Tax=Paenibacillus sp. Soil766 TaxID=1736404 RepID=UPI00070E808A|nr:phosphotransferase [Paenibacillus sp. Soil766]KRE90246.1 hypothetical protein ASG89_08045 [Paenibacillus sp. Soil766]